MTSSYSFPPPPSHQMVPTMSEVVCSARSLGMDVTRDVPLLWIARELLCMPLPKGWEACRPAADTDTADTVTHFFNTHTTELRARHPLENRFRALYLRERAHLYAGRPHKLALDSEVLAFVGVALGDVLVGMSKTKQSVRPPLYEPAVRARECATEPTERALAEQARRLGMRVVADAPLMWIARCALLSPLPHGWVQHTTSGSQPCYYYNTETHSVQWEHPLDEAFKAIFSEESAKREAGQEYKTEADGAVWRRLGVPPPVTPLPMPMMTPARPISPMMQIAAVVPTVCGADAAAKNTAGGCTADVLSENTEEGEEVEDGAVSEDANSSVPSDFVFVPKAVQGAVEEEGVEVQVEEVEGHAEVL